MANELRIHQNHLGGRIDAALTDSGTSLSSPALAAMEVVDTTNHMLVTLDPDGIGGEPEVAMITAHTSGASTATMVRGQEGTSGRAHLVGMDWVHGPLASDIPPSTWTSYTPTWTATTTNPAIGDGTLVGSYLLHGKLLHVRASIVMGSTTTYGTGGNWEIGLPSGLVAKTSTGIKQIGSAFYFDISPTGLYIGICRIDSAGTAFRLNSGNTTSNVADTVPFTWANTDELHLNAVIEVD